MVEAMFERTPEFFRQFRKKFHYFICRSEPIFDTKEINNSFAYSLHENNSFCRIKEQHYHVIAALDQVTEAFKKILQNPILYLAYTHVSDFYSTKHNLSTSLFTVKFLRSCSKQSFTITNIS